MIKISIIIVNYNVKQYLEQALQSILKALAGITSEVYVVDNASTDDSTTMVKRLFPEVILIENKENVGFAKANNQALEKARGETICLINPDTLVREDTFRVCLEYLTNHPNVGAVGCKILNADGTLQLACRRSFPTPWVAFTKVTGLSKLFPKSKLFGKYNLTYLDPDRETEVEALSGAFMVIRKRAVNEAGLLDENFFLYGEDLDWCYRILNKGWKIIYIPTTQIIHYKGRSTQKSSFNSLKMFYGAMHLFVKKHFKKRWSFLPHWFLSIGIFMRSCISFSHRVLNRLLVPIIDIMFIQLGLVLALLEKFSHLKHWEAYRVVDIVYTFIWILCLYIMGLYKKGIYSSSKAITGVLIGLIMNASLTFFFPQYAFSRQVILVAGTLDCIFLSGWRLIIRFVSHIRIIPFFGTVGKTIIKRRTLIVGTGSVSQKILNRLNNQIDGGYEVIGFLGINKQDLCAQILQNKPILGTLQDLKEIAIEHNIQEVIFSPEAASYERILETVVKGKDLHLDFKMVPRNLDVVIGRISIDSLEDIILVDLDYKIFSDPNRIIKRFIDIIVPLILLPFLLPLTIYIYINPSLRFIKVQIYDGTGKPDYIWELRKNNKPVSSLLQYVPLYWEIFIGKMSLIGAEIVYWNKSQKHTSSGKGFKPGLTGLVQVNSKKNLSEKEKERYNLYYMRNYSLMLDFEIILRTIFHF
jgi:GT2 family glycosyltransferase